MDDIPFYKRPWFYIAGWLALLLVLYGWQILRIGGVRESLLYILIDLVCLFPALLVVWIAFFAQFVLPVRTIRDRQKIFDRLITYLSGGHGPAMFIENGIIKEHSGERLKKGPGVVWLDSASAAVTRTAVKIKQTMGPGVHFLDNGEFIAGTVDLHIQSQSIGPKESDKPFDPQDNLDGSEYQQVQDRRKQVSALTRDGIEVVPAISVSFRVDTGFPKEGQPGSRFGFQIGVTKQDRKKEEQDKQAIQKAILGEGINPNISADSPRHRVAWNQVPALLAADIWREYAAKFTLDELFKAEQAVPPAPPPISEPVEEEIDPLTQPIQLGTDQNVLQRRFISTLRKINKFMDRTIKRLDQTGRVDQKKSTPGPASSPAPVKNETQKKTALQVINEMIKARLTQPEVDVFDDHGVRLVGSAPAPSPEFALLRKRGLKVISVSVSNPRLNPAIENAVINKWSGTWLNTAREENKQIDRKRNIIEAAGQEQAIRQYAEKLSIELLRKKPQGYQETLKILIMRTRGIIIENERLRERMTHEQAVLENIIKWMEVNGS